MSTTATKSLRPIVLDDEVLDDYGLDPMESCPFVEIAGSKVREGMVLLDADLACPVAYVDHFIGRACNGSREFLSQNLDTGRYEHQWLGCNSTVKVAAR